MDLNFIAIIVLIGSGKSHQWMLNIWETFNEERDIYMILKCSLTECLVVAKEKNSNHTEEKSGSILIQCHEN